MKSKNALYKNKKYFIVYYLAAINMLLAVVLFSGCAGHKVNTAPSPEKVEDNGNEVDAHNDSGGDGVSRPDIESNSSGSGALVGVALPSKDVQRWKQDGDNIQSGLKEAGYEVDLQYASNGAGEQISQIEDMINNGCKLLMIAPVDGNAMMSVMERAEKEAIPVISYDGLIMNSEAVSYYVSFDDYLAGRKQGEYIRDILDLDNAGDKTYNIEFVTGDLGDGNVSMLFGGAKDVLAKYMDAGTLICPSGQTELDEAATEGWSTDKAQARFETILSAFYSDGKSLDAVLASNDSTALGVTNAIESSYRGDAPVITGQGCDLPNVKNILDGKQTMSIFNDTRTLAKKAVETADAVLRGNTPDVNDTESYHNGARIVPAYICEPVFADSNNYRAILIASGFYAEGDLK